MAEMIIKTIEGLDLQTIWYTVGQKGVTRIEAGRYSSEPYCERLFYQVYKSKNLHVTVNDSAVAQVIYGEQK